MQDLLSYAVKEEIIRSVLKNHNIIFISGWSRTGKTVSLLKSLSGIETRLYFSHLKESQKLALSSDHDIQIMVSLDSFREGSAEETILIIDDFSTADEGTKEQISRFMSKKHPNLKIVVIAKALIDTKDLLPMAEALVRLKKTTAEVIYSIHQDRREDD